jgi:hypothetical protein
VSVPPPSPRSEVRDAIRDNAHQLFTDAEGGTGQRFDPDAATDAVLGVLRQRIEARPFRCPVHGMTDCSPLLNGCSIPNQAAAWALVLLGGDA